MSPGIANVQARIASIQSQLAMLQPVRQPARPLGGAPPLG